MAVLEAYGLARDRAKDPANLTKARRELNSGLSALLKTWRSELTLPHASGEGVSANFSDRRLVGLWAAWSDANRPKKLSPLVMSGQGAGRVGALAELMEEMRLRLGKSSRR